jgi:Kef-type K+ transport system membrane component KefB
LIATQIDVFNILLLISFALILARLLGHLFTRFNQPAVIGEILAGILLGALVVVLFSGNMFMVGGVAFALPQLSYPLENGLSPFKFLADIGILLLLFISGIEISISKLKKVEKVSSLVAAGGVILPFILGILSGMILGLQFQESIVIGLILVATSVGVTVRTLLDLRVLDTDVGATILGSAVIDDVIGILLLAFALGIESLLDAVWIGLRIALFFLFFLYVGLKIIDRILELGEKIILPKALLSITLAILLIYSFFADKAGISGIIGAFVAGVLIGQNVRSRLIEDDIKTLGYGFFIPLFFVWVGYSLWIGLEPESISVVTLLIMVIVIIIVSIAGKIVGCGIGAKLAGMSTRESLQVGIGMIPRMELALIIVTAALSHEIIKGTIGTYILITTILMTTITTLVTPLLIKVSFKNE